MIKPNSKCLLNKAEYTISGKFKTAFIFIICSTCYTHVLCARVYLASAVWPGAPSSFISQSTDLTVDGLSSCVRVLEPSASCFLLFSLFFFNTLFFPWETLD